MDVSSAAYHLVHHYPGGASSLAPRLGKSATTLSHEVDPNYPGAKLGLEDAVDASAFAQDLRILHAFAARMSCMVIQLGVAPSQGADTMAEVAALAKEFGALLGEVSSTMADGVVSDNERARVEKAAGELMQAMEAVLSRVQALNEAGKPAHLRQAA